MTDVPVVRASASFDAFYRSEYRQVVGLAYVLSGSRSAAEEIAQEAFLAVLRDWPRVSGLDQPKTWVRRIAANHAVSRFRRLRSEARAMTRFHRDSTPLEVSAEALDVWSAVRALPLRQAQAIALKYMGGLSVKEVAAAMECSPETVRTHLERGRARLKGQLS